MKNAPHYTKKFGSLYRQIKSGHPAEPVVGAEPVTQMIVGFLEWNATRRAARKAHEALMANMVDTNEVRVSRPDELLEIIGRDYPQAEERIERMHESLHEVFLREQVMSLEVVSRKSKKEIRHYLDTLPGMTPYVAAQMTLLCFDGHAVPVDDRLAEALRAAGAADAEATIEEIESFLERQFKAGQGIEAHTHLMAWVDAGSRRATAAAPRRVASVASRKPTRTKSAPKASKKK